MGCSKLIVTGSDFKSNSEALKLAAEYPGVVYSTAGIHPCSSSIFKSGHVEKEHTEDEDEHTTPCEADGADPLTEDGVEADLAKTEEIVARLRSLVDEARSAGQKQLVAFGEFGLDYDRLNFCSKKIQLHSFAAQLQLAAALEPQLPLFLHSRAAHDDFCRLLKEAFGPKLERLQKGGVVHSFTGSIEEAGELMDLGLYIGINGCSFKTDENCEVVKGIPLDKIMIETDGPWCEIRPSHAGYKHLIEKKPEAPAENGDGPKRQPKKNQKKEPDFPERFKTVKKEKWVEGAMIKGRNEPCSIERVAKVIAGIKGVTVEEVCDVAWKNTVKVFDVE